MFNINNEIFIRQELNGVTVYDSNINKYIFYKNVVFNNYFDMFNILTKDNLHEFLKKYEISNCINFKYPFRINWLISDYCNLNCIYCFANNKFNIPKDNKINYDEIVNNLLNYRPLSVGLTGGEPTLNLKLSKIIDSLAENCSIIIDTNGTTNLTNTLLNSIIKSNSIVRITIDSIDDSILSLVRPFCINSFKKISNNIQKLLDNDVRVIIHTVVTQKNLSEIHKIYDYIVDKKIVKWQLYPVSYTEKCKEIYDSIKVSNEELDKLQKILDKKNNGKIDVKVYKNSSDFSSRAVLMLNKNGKYFVDTIYNGIEYCGKNSYKPTLSEIKNCLNKQNHIDDYLS